MINHPIGVYGGPELLGVLQGLCPSHAFVDGEERQRCRIVIIVRGVDIAAADVPRKSLVRVVLDDATSDGERHEGDMRLPRATFLARPEDTLAVALDLVATITHASRLETEVAYL